MARPIDVSQLIAGINKKKGLDENTSGKISKPRFLNKQERSKQERLKENEESLTPTQSDSAKVEIKR